MNSDEAEFIPPSLEFMPRILNLETVNNEYA